MFMSRAVPSQNSKLQLLQAAQSGCFKWTCKWTFKFRRVFFLHWKLHCQMTVFTESYFVKCNIKSKGIFCSLKTTMGKGFTNFKSIWQQLLNITIENSQNIKCTKPTLPRKGILTLKTRCKYIDHHNNKAPPFIQWWSVITRHKLYTFGAFVSSQSCSYFLVLHRCCCSLPGLTS